uniref:Uncharacterized protein n=1 Tax=Vitis vinifera TaxID=29760 RepID=A5BYH2_VITVI|nr:hypothetical protein VITISV_035125 [Vitis vinifera]
MNFMSYVAEVSRGWDEPNARDMGRMKSQPNAKGEMYILNDGIDMKAKIAAMARRLEELEMKNMQEVQAISQTPLLPMPCSICRSYEHLVDECPTIPTEREMFGDCNTYNSNWRDHPNFSWKPQPPQYNKFVGDFVGAQKSINAQFSQRIDSVESSLIKRMDEVQNDLSQKIDNLQDSISRFANLNTVQEKENSPSQPYQNSMSIHEMEAKGGEPSQKREVKEVITLRSGKEVDLPTCKLEHKVESETEKEKREEIKGKKKGKSIAKDGYDVNVQREPQRIVIKKELMKKHMPPPFLQALYDKIIQRKPQGKNRGKTGVCEISQPLRNRHFAVKPVRSLKPLSTKIFAAAKPSLAHECHFAAQEPPFRSCETAAKLQNVKNPNFAAKAPFGRLRNELRKWPLAAKSPLGSEMVCENATLLRNDLQASKWLRNDLQASKWLRNHLQKSKWPSNCEIDLQNGGRLHVTQEVPLPPYFSIAFVTLRTMFSLVGGRVEEANEPLKKKKERKKEKCLLALKPEQGLRGIWCLGIKIHSQKSGVKSEELVVERPLKLDALNLNWLGVIDGPPLHGQFRKEYL